MNILFYDTMVQMQTLKITRSLNVGFSKIWFDLSLRKNTQKTGINTPSNPAPLPLPNLKRPAEAGFIRR